MLGDLDRFAAAEGALRAAGEQGATAAHLPDWLVDQVRADGAAGRFRSWGRSTVLDENVGSPVIARGVFDDLHALAGLGADDAAWPIGNAGLLHVYGYLLSNVVTPYGLKRDRWLDGGVARAFGLPSGAFAPWFETPSAGDSTSLERILAVTQPFVDDPGDGDLTLLWVDEHGPAAPAAPETFARTIVVRDDDTGAAALVYAVGTVGDVRPVTAFPLDWASTPGGADDWLAALEAEPPRLRYNSVDSRNVPSAPLAERHVMLRDH